MQSKIPQLYNALIKTHHITSRKKVSKLKKEAHSETEFVLIRSGGSPGLMYVEGAENGVKEWVDAVQGLRYKDYQLLCRPAPLESDASGSSAQGHSRGFDERGSVQEFASVMEKKGLLSWWRQAMGYDRRSST